MSSVNKVILVGRLGTDPELHQFDEGRAKCTLSLATSRHYKNREGEKQEETTWHRVVCWGRQAEVCNSYLSKGRRIYVEGRMDHRSYTDKEGQKRYISEVVGNQLVFLDGPRNGESQHRDAPAGEVHDPIPF